MKRYQRTGISQYIFVGIALILVIGITFLSMFIMERLDYEDHFIYPWAAGRMWLLEGMNPYDAGVLDYVEETLAESNYLGRLPDSAVFHMPIVSLVPYLPFSLIPFDYSRALWVTALALCIIGLGYFSLLLSGWKLTKIETVIVLALIFLWLPSLLSIVQGHISPVTILFVFGSIYLVLKGQDTAAGLLLALSFGDFFTTGIIIILVLLWSLSRRRWSIIGAFFAGVAFLISISVILLPSWPLDWLRNFVQTFNSLDVLRTPLLLLANRLPGISQYLTIVLHGLLSIYLLTNWITLWGKEGRIFIWIALISLVAAYLLHVQASYIQLTLIVPAIFMVFRFWTDRWRLIGKILSWLFITLITIGPWLLIYPNINFVRMEPLPVLIVVLPLLVFTGMIWNRWWALKIPKFIFEDK